MTSFTVKIRVNDVVYRQITVKMDYTFRKTFCCNIFWISRGAPTWPQQLLSSLSRPQTSVPASLMVNKVFQNKRKNREFGQPYLRSWWPHFMLKLQGMRTSKFWVCGWFAPFFQCFLTNNLIWLMVARMLVAKKGTGRGHVCGVSSPLFSFAITHLHCCQDQQNERIGGLKIERKNGRSERQNVKTSNDRFFPSWQIFPRKLRHWDSQGSMAMFNYQRVVG